MVNTVLDDPSFEDVVERQARTGSYCTACEAHLHYGEDCIFCTVQKAKLVGGLVQFSPVVLEDDETGEVELLYDSCVIHDECFQRAYGELQDLLADVPPRHWPQAQELPVLCGGCGSPLVVDEPHAHFWHVTADMPDVCPQGTYELVWRRSAKAPYILCISCLATWHDKDMLRIWRHFIGANGECAKCTRRHCWAEGTACGCWCHRD
jgi:hypothetical protein